MGPPSKALPHNLRLHNRCRDLAHSRRAQYYRFRVIATTITMRNGEDTLDEVM